MTAPAPSRRRIVIGVDGSGASIAALRMAVRMAPVFDAELDAVIAWHYPDINAMAPLLAAFDPATDATTVIRAAIDDAFGDSPPTGLRQLRQEGHPSRVLLDASVGAEMLIVGSRGHGGFAGLLLGSVSAHCAEHATCPVLVVHSNVPTPTRRSDERPSPMSLPVPADRATNEPRLNVHNTNIDEDSAAAGECGTLDLANGWICRQPAQHRDGCTFEAPTGSRGAANRPEHGPEALPE